MEQIKVNKEEYYKLKVKADKWDELDMEISKFYEEDAEGDLVDIGEICAMKLGYL